MLVGARQAAEMFVDLVRRCKKQKTKQKKKYIYIMLVDPDTHTFQLWLMNGGWRLKKYVYMY